MKLTDISGTKRSVANTTCSVALFPHSCSLSHRCSSQISSHHSNPNSAILANHRSVYSDQSEHLPVPLATQSQSRKIDRKPNISRCSFFDIHSFFFIRSMLNESSASLYLNNSVPHLQYHRSNSHLTTRVTVVRPQE